MNRWQISTVQQLRQEGWTRRQLTDAVEDGSIWRHRKGYYSEPDAPAELQRAVRLGGLATGPTALQFRSMWVPPDEPLHVQVRRTASRLSDPDHRYNRLVERPDLRVHWTDATAVRLNLLNFEPLVDTLQALEHTIRSCLPEYAIAAADSALHRRIITQADLRALQARLPKHLAALLNFCDGRAEAGSESVVRFRLQTQGLRVEPQVHIPGVGRVDLLIEGRLVLETDGRRYHDTHPQFVEDRRRDRALALQRYGYLRLTYEQTFYDWPTSNAAIHAALGR